MAKQENKGKNSKKQRLQDLQLIKKRSRRLEQQVAMECNHQKSNGDLDVHWVSEEDNLVQCNICEDTFSMEVINKDELKLAQRIIHNAIQQMRALATDEEQDTVENLGRIDYAVTQVPKQYNRLIDALAKGGKKKKKKNKNRGNGNRIAGYDEVFDIVGRRGKK